MWKYITHPLVFIGLCAAAAYYLLPKDAFPLGSQWWRSANDETWTVIAKKNAGRSIVFGITSPNMSNSVESSPIDIGALDIDIANGAMKRVV
jgi:hypothetical protein